MTEKPYPEVTIAAKWWADQLRKNVVHNDAGDGDLNMALAWGYARLRKPFTSEQIDAFEQALVLGIQENCDKEGWDESNPIWGGYMRAIGVDYHPDMILDAAGQSAGIDVDWQLPVKTVMWINPGSVTVRNGYGAEVKALYPVEEGE